MGLHTYYWFSTYEQHQNNLKRNITKLPWNGPIKQAYFGLYGTPITILDITLHEDIYRIQTIDFKNIIGMTFQFLDQKWSAQHLHPKNLSQNIYISQDSKTKFDTIHEVILIARQSYNRILKEENEIAANPSLQLERLLSTHDWYYHMSDDHSVWQAGNNQSRKIHELKHQVPTEKFRKLWQQYAPQEFLCPV